jgi:hypothetical protein
MRKFTLAMMMLALFAASVFAQGTTGRLLGTVTDAKGDVVAGATVVVKDKKTNKERTTTSDSNGSFLFQLLDTGSYTIKVTAQGFKTSTTEVIIQVSQEYSLPVVLEVGGVGETVTVTAGADVINSTNAELSSTLTNKQITELPLAARNPLSLTLTQAGTASNPSQGTSINGSRTSSTNITRDGVNIQDNFIRSNATDFAPGRPSVDNVEEFTLTSQSSVDAGFGGAQITFVTPRGGNSFRGAGWIYNRNSALGANGWFSNAGGNYGATDPAVIAGFRRLDEERAPRPYRNRNQYGFKIGGPIVKDKLFFFVFGERLKDIIQAPRVITVLTQTARQGIFRYTSGVNTFSTSIFAPGIATGGVPATPIPTAINATTSTLFLNNMPVGNSFEVGDGLNTQGYRFFQAANSDRDNFTSRVDYDFNEKNNISAVIDYNLEKNLRNDVDTYSPTPKVNQPARNVLYSGGWRFSPNSTFSNEFRVGQFFSVPDFLRTDSLPSTYYVPTLISNPIVTFQEQGRRVRTTNLQNTSTWQLGSHSVRFGAQYQNVNINAYNFAGVIQTYILGLSATNGPLFSAASVASNAGGPGLTAAQSATAQGLFALLGGVIGSGNQTFNANSQSSGYVLRDPARRELGFNSFAPYVSDSWRVSPELTLNFGLRYDYQTPVEGISGNYLEPKLNSGQTIQQSVLDPAGTFQFLGVNAGKANTFHRTDKDNLAYNISAAYAPREINNPFLKFLFGKNNFVIRGGFRSSYVNDETVRAPENAFLGNAGFNLNFPAINTAAATSIGNLNDRLGSPLSAVPFPTFNPNRTYTTNNDAFFNFTGTVFAVDPNLQTPKQYDYQVGIQRRLGDFAFEARYVGSHSKNMLRTIDYNQIKLDSAYLTDFNTVRANIVGGCATQALCAGTTVFSSTVSPGFNSLLTNATIRNLFTTGQAAELIWVYLINGLMPNPNTAVVPAGTLRARFLANPNAGVANVLENGGKFFYNSGQFEVRRQFKDGFYIQANYTFSKELTDAVGTGQTRVEPFLDNNNPDLDYTRADFDQTHIINVNSIYEIPVGKGRRYLNDNKILDYVLGGWQLGVVWRIASGAPITFTDSRGTLNRAGRSGRQTALTNLTAKELKKLVGTFKTQCGVYFVNPSAINLNFNNLYSGNCGGINTGVATGTTGGAASSGFGQPLFAGQVFFSNGPGQTSGLRRAVVNGPWTASADISLLKNFKITETSKLQIRGEAFNLTNTPFFVPGQFIDINSTTFGRVTGTFGSRVVQVAARFEF